MNTSTLKYLFIDGVEVEIRVNNISEEDTTKQFLYELLNFDDD